MAIETTQEEFDQLTKEDRLKLADRLDELGETIEIVEPFNKEVSHAKEEDFNSSVHAINTDVLNESMKNPNEEKSMIDKSLDFAKGVLDDMSLPFNNSIQKSQDAVIKPLVENPNTKPYVKAIEDTANTFTPLGEFDFASQYDDKQKDMIMQAIENEDLPLKAYNKINKLAKTNLGIVENKEEGIQTYEENLEDVVIELGFDELHKDEHNIYYAVKGKKQVEINKSTLKDIVSDMYGDKMEILGSILGAKKGYDLGKNFGKKGQFISATVGGALGATTGNVADMIDSILENGEELNASQIANEVIKAGALDAGAGVVTAGLIKGGRKAVDLVKQNNPLGVETRADAYKDEILNINDNEVVKKSQEIEQSAKEFGGNNNQELTTLVSHDETEKSLSDMYDNSVESRKAVTEDNQKLTDNVYNKLNIEEKKADKIANTTEKNAGAITSEVNGIEKYYSDLYSSTKEDIVTIAGNENIALKPSVVDNINKNIKALESIENVQKKKISSEKLNEFEKDYSSMLDLISTNLKHEVDQGDGVIIKEDVDTYTLTGMMDLQKKFNDFFYKHNDKLTVDQKKKLGNIKTAIYDDIEKYIETKFAGDSKTAKEVTDKWKSVNADISSWKKDKGRFKVLQDIVDSKVDLNTLTSNFINKNGDIDKDGLAFLGKIAFQLGKSTPLKLDEFYGAVVNNMLESTKVYDTAFGKDVRYIDFEKFNKLYDDIKGQTLNKTFGGTKRGREIIDTLDKFRTLAKNEEKIQNSVLKKQSPLDEAGRTSKESTRDFLFGVGYAIRHRLLGFMSKRLFRADAFHQVVTDLSKKRRYGKMDFDSSIKKLKLKNEKLPVNKKYAKEEIEELVKIRTEIEEFEKQRAAEYKELQRIAKQIEDKKEKELLAEQFRVESEELAKRIDAKLEYEAQRNKDMSIDYQLTQKPESKPENQIEYESIKVQEPANKRVEELSKQLDKANETPQKVKQQSYEKEKQRVLNAIEVIKSGNSKKEIVELVDDAERDDILEHFNIKIKHPNNFTRTIDKSQIDHVLKNHGDVEKEAKRGNIALSEEDISKYIEIVHNHDKKAYTYNNQKKPTVVYGKQDDGYYIVVEEVRAGKSDLAFFTMRKTKGELTEDALIPSRSKSFTSETTSPDGK